VDGVVVRQARHLLDVVEAFLPQRSTLLPLASRDPPSGGTTTDPDLADIKGQSAPKRALEIAAAGNLSLLSEPTVRPMIYGSNCLDNTYLVNT